MKLLSMDESYAERDLNVGFSGGEKKKAELISSTLLKVPLNAKDLKANNKIIIKQINSLNVEFRKSEEYIFKYSKSGDDEPEIDDEDTGNIAADEAKSVDETSEKKKK